LLKSYRAFILALEGRLKDLPVAHNFFKEGKKMCELKVIVEGNTVFKDVVYAKADGSAVIVKDVLGESKEFQNCKIVEVDVNTARLVLSPIES